MRRDCWQSNLWLRPRHQMAGRWSLVALFPLFGTDGGACQRWKMTTAVRPQFTVGSADGGSDSRHRTLLHGWIGRRRQRAGAELQLPAAARSSVWLAPLNEMRCARKYTAPLAALRGEGSWACLSPLTSRQPMLAPSQHSTGHTAGCLVEASASESRG